MKKLALKTYGKVVGLIFAFIGIITGSESCAMYGTPSADFIIKGKVTDATTDQPVRNIRVVVPFLNSDNYGDTTFTNSNGEYVIKQNDFPSFDTPKLVIAADVDGQVNGLYGPDTLKVYFTKKDRIKRGSGGWYEGTFEKTNQNFKLQKSNIIPMYGVMPAKFEEKKKN